MSSKIQFPVHRATDLVADPSSGSEVRGAWSFGTMNGMMGGPMMGLISILVIVVLVLAAAALIKYLFFSKRE